MFHALLVFLSELKETISETVKYLFSKPFGRVLSRCKDWLGTRFKSWIWDVDWRRDVTLIIVAALIVIFANLDKLKQSLGRKKIQEILLSEIFKANYEVIIFCGIIVTLYLLTKLPVNIKKIRFFLGSFLGFLAVKYYSLIVESYWSYIDQNPILNNIVYGIIHQTNLKWDQILTISNILQLIATILVGILLYLFIRLLSRSSGIDIIPFDHPNPDPNDESIDGKGISYLLAAELHRIYHLHNFIEDGKLQLIQNSSPLLRVCREDLNLSLFKGEKLERALSQAGSIPITDKTSLQIGEILLGIRQLWPSGTSQVITGSINKYDSKLQLSARYEETNHHSDIHAYKVEQKDVDQAWGIGQESISLVPRMVKNLAYRIALDLSSTSLSTSNWLAFQSLTEALSHFYRHERTSSHKSLEELNQAFALCKKAIENDKNYTRVADFLSLIALSYLNQERYQQAEDALTKAIEINPRSPYVHSVYGNKYYLLGEYEKALNYYEFAKKLAPQHSAIYIRTGSVHLVAPPPLRDYSQARKDFWCALNLDPNNHAAQSLLAWLDFMCHLKEQEEGHYEKSEISLDKALNRLKRMPQNKKTYIDYSNLAIFLFYKGDEKEAHLNWWKALQLCPSDTSDPGNRIYDCLHCIFYKLLTARSIEEITQQANKLKQLLAKNRDLVYKRVIEGLLLDANIILWKYIGLTQVDWRSEKFISDTHNTELNLVVIDDLEIIDDRSMPENWLIGMAMKLFIKILSTNYT